jgi:hypothetical protein
VFYSLFGYLSVFFLKQHAQVVFYNMPKLDTEMKIKLVLPTFLSCVYSLLGFFKQHALVGYSG